MTLPYFNVTPKMDDVISKGDTRPVPFAISNWRTGQSEYALEFQRVVCEMYHATKSIVPVTFTFVNQNGHDQIGTFNHSTLNGQYEGGHVKLVIEAGNIVGLLPGDAIYGAFLQQLP